ncbi:MAG: YceI family protein [Ignavibacteria bacterium]|nr:YceI family protein [Ignavibacteria bacterium]
MKKILLSCSLSLLFFGFVSENSPKRASYTAHIEDKSRLYISGSSNVNTFECNSRDKSAPISFDFTLNDKGDTLRLSNAMLLLYTKNLDCSNSRMNADLCDAMKANQYPTIKIDLLGAMMMGGANFEDVEGDWKPLKVLANLTITNVTKRVVLEVKARRIEGNKYRFVSVKDVHMTDYNVQPPEVMLGMIKVNNLIKLNIDIVARLTKE